MVKEEHACAKIFFKRRVAMMMPPAGSIQGLAFLQAKFIVGVPPTFAEELAFVGVVVLILVCIFLLWRSKRREKMRRGL